MPDDLIEQVDREAAADAYDAIAGCTVPLDFGKRVRAGEVSELTERFAHHRVSSTAALKASADEMASHPDVGWIVGNASGDKWRAWIDGMPEWVDDRSKATRYCFRSDAEAVHANDEDAWRVVPCGEPDQVTELTAMIQTLLAACGSKGGYIKLTNAVEQAEILLARHRHRIGGPDAG